MINTVIHGDCLELMKKIPDGYIDMILCDLPYGVTKNKWDIVIPFDKLWEQYERIIKDNGAIILTASQPFATDVITSNRKLFRYDLIWEKSIATGFLNANRMPLRGHEHILIFYKKMPVYNPQKFMLSTPSFKKGNKCRTSENYGKYITGGNIGTKDGSRFPRSIFSINYESEFFDATGNKKTIHPTQKPVSLFAYLINTYSNEGDLILDNCAGSGTTAIACIKTNRNYILMEKEEKYYLSILNRIKQHQSQLTFNL